MTIEIKDIYLDKFANKQALQDYIDNELESYEEEPEFEVYEFDDSMLDPKVIERGIKDIEEGRGFTLEEVKKNMRAAAGHL
jgi:hypothetical protein